MFFYFIKIITFFFYNLIFTNHCNKIRVKIFVIKYFNLKKIFIINLSDKIKKMEKNYSKKVYFLSDEIINDEENEFKLSIFEKLNLFKNLEKKYVKNIKNNVRFI